MANVKVTIDGNEYTEEQFRKDLTRMFDTYRDKNSSDMGNMTCNGVCCDDCPLYKVSCNMKTTNSLKTIGLVYEWALKHPVFTNKDMLEKTFGEYALNHISSSLYGDLWLKQEYKEPRKEEND